MDQKVKPKAAAGVGANSRPTSQIIHCDRQLELRGGSLKGSQFLTFVGIIECGLTIYLMEMERCLETAHWVAYMKLALSLFVRAMVAFPLRCILELRDMSKY